MSPNRTVCRRLYKHRIVDGSVIREEITRREKKESGHNQEVQSWRVIR